MNGIQKDLVVVLVILLFANPPVCLFISHLNGDHGHHAHESRRQGSVERPDPFLPQHPSETVADPLVGAGIVGHLR